MAVIAAQVGRAPALAATFVYVSNAERAGLKPTTPWFVGRRAHTESFSSSHTLISD